MWVREREREFENERERGVEIVFSGRVMMIINIIFKIQKPGPKRVLTPNLFKGKPERINRLMQLPTLNDATWFNLI